MSVKSRRKKPGDPNVAVAYMRVSKEEQTLSPQAQRDAITRWATANEVLIIGWHLDRGLGGATPLEDRPALMNALAELTPYRAGLLVIARRDRLARDFMIAAMIEQLVSRAGASIAHADGTNSEDTPEGQLLRGVMDLFAQYERAIIQFRTKSALAVKKARGEAIGPDPPFGMRAGADGKMLEPHPEEQKIIAKIVQWHAEMWSMREICDKLTEIGASPRGARWHQTTIARILAAHTA